MRPPPHDNDTNPEGVQMANAVAEDPIRQSGMASCREPVHVGDCMRATGCLSLTEADDVLTRVTVHR